MSVFLLVGETYDDLSLQKMDEYFQITLADSSRASPIVALCCHIYSQGYIRRFSWKVSEAKMDSYVQIILPFPHLLWLLESDIP